MLNALRRGTGSWIIKALLGLLVLSFVVWGVADVFRGFGASTLVTVGPRTITPEQYSRAFEDDLNQLSARFGRRITREQARMFGLETQTLSRLVGEAVLSNEADSLKLGISEQGILDAVKRDPSFHGINGQFDPDAFKRLLRANGLSEAGFFARQREAILRGQITEGLLADLTASKAATDALNIYRNETRTVSYVVVPESKAPAVAAPDDDKLKAYYDANTQRFSTSEMRKIAVLTVTAQDLKKPEAISDEAVKTAYEDRKSRYETPEKRKLEQLVFKDKAAADKAHAELKSGKDFMAVAKELGLKDSDVQLGTMTKKQMVDAKVADAAFALEKGAFSAPVEGTFSTVIVRAVDVTPGSTKTLDEVKAELRDALALEKAEEEVQNLIDTVERARSRGANLKETAEKANLKVKEIAAVDQSGKDADGKPVDALKEAAPLLARIFQTDVGIEADGVELPGGYGWFEVQAITPAKPKPLESIKEEVTKAWTEVEKAKSLRTFAQTLVERVGKGETIDAIAKDLGLEAKTSKPLKRSESADDLPAPAVNLMFALGKGVAGQSEAGKDKGRVVFAVKDITAPPALTDEDRKQLGLELSRQMSADLSGELLGALQERSGVKVNQEALKRVMGITTQ